MLKRLLLLERSLHTNALLYEPGLFFELCSLSVEQTAGGTLVVFHTRKLPIKAQNLLVAFQCCLFSSLRHLHVKDLLLQLLYLVQAVLVCAQSAELRRLSFLDATLEDDDVMGAACGWGRALGLLGNIGILEELVFHFTAGLLKLSHPEVEEVILLPHADAQCNRFQGL